MRQALGVCHPAGEPCVVRRGSAQGQAQAIERPVVHVSFPLSTIRNGRHAGRFSRLLPWSASGMRRPIDIGPAVVRPGHPRHVRLEAAGAYATTDDGLGVRLATQEQAVGDAPAEPQWMIHGDLLAEVIAAMC